MNPFAALTDEEVLTKYYEEENDDRANLAFTELDRRFRPRLILSITQPGYHKGFVKLYRKPGMEGMAEDLVTQALWRVAETRGKPSVRWKPERGKVAGWIFGILRYTVLSHLRLKKVPMLTTTDLMSGDSDSGSPLDKLPARGLGPDEALQHQALVETLRACFEELPGELRTICEMIYQRGMKQSDIARELRTSQPTLTRRKQEACDLLRACLHRKGVAADVFD